MKCSFGVSNFLEEISSLSHSIVFLYFFALIAEKAFLSLLAILWNSAFKWVYLSFCPLLLASLLFSAICKASSVNHFAVLHFFSLGMVLITASCTMSQTSVHGSSGTLSINKGQKWCGPNRSRNIKKRWQAYTEQLYKKDLHDSDNPDGVITLDPDILECEVGPRKHHYEQS